MVCIVTVTMMIYSYYKLVTIYWLVVVLTILKHMTELRQWISDDPIYEMENKQCLKRLTRISPTYNMKHPEI